MNDQMPSRHLKLIACTLHCEHILRQKRRQMDRKTMGSTEGAFAKEGDLSPGEADITWPQEWTRG